MPTTGTRQHCTIRRKIYNNFEGVYTRETVSYDTRYQCIYQYHIHQLRRGPCVRGNSKCVYTNVAMRPIVIR